MHGHYAWLLRLLLSPQWRYAGLTFVATILSLVVKGSSRPDPRRLDREDWAVGFDLMQVAMFALLGDGAVEVVRASQRGNPALDDALVQFIVSFVALFFMFLILIVLSVLVRWYGWNVSGRHAELKTWAILTPLPFGLIYIAICVILLAS